MSYNSIKLFNHDSSLSHLSKLKRIILKKNEITDYNLKGFKSLEYISLEQNRIEILQFPDDLENLLYLDLSGNRITSMYI